MLEVSGRGGGLAPTLSLLGPVNPVFRALYGRLKLTVRRHKSNENSLDSTLSQAPQTASSDRVNLVSWKG